MDNTVEVVDRDLDTARNRIVELETEIAYVQKQLQTAQDRIKEIANRR